MKRPIFILLIALAFFMLAINEVCACPRVIVRQEGDVSAIFSKENTKYIIKDNIDLAGKRVKIAKGSTLVFRGGSLFNGTIVGNDTRIKASNYEIFKRGYTRYKAYIAKDARRDSPPSLIKEYHNAIIIEGTWSNNKCCSNWTGLQNDSNEDVMLPVKNYIVLHSPGSLVKLPRLNALGYESTILPGGYIIDFNNSIINYPDNLDNWVDPSIKIPDGATACPMESGYGMISVKSNTTIKNLSVDGKSNMRQNETLRLGVSCIICLGNSKSAVIENVSLYNVLGPAMTANAKSKDILFKNCKFYNIGEHIMYSQQYEGYCYFDGCSFDTWDSERLSVHRNGMDYVYKHIPYKEGMDASYEELYSFDLRFKNCSFNNPKRVNSQGRTLGGFITCNFPLVVSVENCSFKGALPVFNPGGGSTISEQSGKPYKMIVRNCNGAPYVYPSKSNFNIITEFYNCKNIPFRTVYAKRYDHCEMYIDVYENSIENVSSSFNAEFSEPLVVKNCIITDKGSNVLINHPVLHRPIVFENCDFSCDIQREYVASVVKIATDNLSMLTIHSCKFDMPGYRIVGGGKNIGTFTVKNCVIESVKPNYFNVRPSRIIMEDNSYSEESLKNQAF